LWTIVPAMGLRPPKVRVFGEPFSVWGC
jgi:hypothetical protein